MAGRTNRAHDARARARVARAVMLQERQEQDARIEEAVAAALLAMEDRADALAQAEQEERNLALALQRLGPEGVTVRDIVTMTGLSENKVNRLVRMRVDGPGEDLDDGPAGVSDHLGDGNRPAVDGGREPVATLRPDHRSRDRSDGGLGGERAAG